MKLAILAYVPPPKFGCAEVFLRNVRKFKTHADLVLYSDHPYPGVVPLKGNPEMLKDATHPVTGRLNGWSVNNFVFFTGLRIAKSQGYSHVIYLESDCRVGCDLWDETMWEEAFAAGRPFVTAGSVVCYNPANWSAEALRRWAEVVATAVHGGHRIPPTYGWKGAAHKHPSCVFPNGALSILNLEAVCEMFDIENTAKTAIECQPWDMEIGMRLWDQFQEQTFDAVVHLNSVFSGYGDVLSSEPERMAMLRSGQVVGVHQVKSGATI